MVGVQRFVGLFVLALSLAACTASRPRADIPYAQGEFAMPDNQFTASGEDAYRIGPLDVVKVSVFEVPEISGNYEVNAMGNLQLPLVGAIPAQRLTSTELAERLKQKLSEKYFQDPDVIVSIAEIRSKQVTIDGSIDQPGVYPIAGNTTLLQAVAMAKGLSSDANPGRVVIFRTIEGRRAAAAFDLNRVREGLTPDPEVYGNDVIVVDGSRSRAALRDVVRTLPLLAIFRFL